MSRFAIQIDDRTLAIARDGVVLHSAPAVSFTGLGGERVGADAWSVQRRTPTHVSTRHLAEIAAGEHADRSLAIAAAELARRLEAYRAGDDSPAWLAAAAAFGSEGLSAVFAIARQLGVPVAGFVDAATASVAALAPGRTALVLEIGLHHVAVTAVEAGGAIARRRRAATSLRGGLLDVYEAWLNLIGAAMVERTRFDPLHDAATEQQVWNALPELARVAVANGVATASLMVGEERFESALSRDQFARAAEPVYREIVRLFHELLHAGGTATILAPRVVLEMPGLREALEGLRNCELVLTVDGYAAAAATVVELPAVENAGGETVRLVRRLAAAPSAAVGSLAESMPMGAELVSEQAASHVLYQGRAFTLGSGPLVVGRATGEATVGIALPEGLAGISRRHCSFVQEGGQLVLVDHSAYGTFVNGARVAERVRVRAGDRVRIGEPGVELALIAVGA